MSNLFLLLLLLSSVVYGGRLDRTLESAVMNVEKANVEKSNVEKLNLENASGHTVDSNVNKDNLVEVKAKLMGVVDPDPSPVPVTSKGGGIVVNIPPLKDPITGNLKLWLIVIAICVALCACCAFVYFCHERLIPVLAFLEHCVFYIIKGIILPYKLCVEFLKVTIYPMKV